MTNRSSILSLRGIEKSYGPIHMSKSMAMEWVGHGIRVNTASFVTGVNLLVDGGFCCW